MYGYFVKQSRSNKPFLFTSNDKYDDGDEVVCQTRLGEKRGQITGSVLGTESDIKQLSTACGGYWPLAPILRKYVKPVVTSIDDVPPEIVGQIRRQAISDMMAKLSALYRDVMNDERDKPPFDV